MPTKFYFYFLIYRIVKWAKMYNVDLFASYLSEFKINVNSAI